MEATLLCYLDSFFVRDTHLAKAGDKNKRPCHDFVGPEDRKEPYHDWTAKDHQPFQGRRCRKERRYWPRSSPLDLRGKNIFHTDRWPCTEPI